MATPRAFVDAIHGKRSLLFQYIDIKHGLLTRLLDMDVITREQQQDIEGKSTDREKIDHLLKNLECRADELFPRLCEALDLDGQSHVTKILCTPAPAGPSGVKVSNPSDATQSSRTRADHSATHLRLRTEMIPAEVKVVPFAKLSTRSVPQQIAEGGFGIIYRAEHDDWGPVAFKKLKVAVLNSKDKTARELQKEAEAQCLRHDNIVSILGIVFEPDNYGVVMEYAMYGGLDDFIDKYTVEMLMKMSLAHGVVLGMNYLHTYTRNGQPSPVIHGDLKMQNVLVADGYVAKICDFGLSKWRKFSTAKTTSTSVRGTVTHLPPETWNDINYKRDTKVDVYSFGILMYELLSEEQAFSEAKGNIPHIREAVTSGQRPPLADITSDEPDAGVIIKGITDRIPTFWAQQPGDRPEFSEIKEIFDSFMRDFETKVAISKANLDAEIAQASRPENTQ